MNRSIVVVGSVNLDLVCTASKIPAPGETVWGDRFQTFHGGKGANQAVAAARLGGAVALVGKVGDDDFGSRLRQGLQESHVDVDRLATVAGIASGVALISVDRQGQNSITVVPGANGELRPADLECCLPILRSAGIILTQLETPLETVEYLCAMAHTAGVPLMLDPAPARALPDSLLRCVTYLTPNETETCALCGLQAQDLTPDQAPAVARRLQASGPANVILKMGQHGAFVASSDGSDTFVPAFAVDAVDTTAAGDAFNGGMAVALMRGSSLAEAAQFAAAVAAVSVTRAGAQPAMPTLDEVAAVFARSGLPCGKLFNATTVSVT